MVHSNIAIQKVKNGSTARTYHTKEEQTSKSVAPCLAFWVCDRTITALTAMDSPTHLALLSRRHVIFLKSWLLSIPVAFFSRHPMVLTSSTFWGLRCNLGFTFTTSRNNFLGHPCSKFNLVTNFWPQQLSGNLLQASIAPSHLHHLCLPRQHHGDDLAKIYYQPKCDVT